MSEKTKVGTRKLEKEIKSVIKLVHREGRTDAIDEQLDELEHRIGVLGKSEQYKSFAERLMDQLDKVK